VIELVLIIAYRRWRKAPRQPQTVRLEVHHFIISPTAGKTLPRGQISPFRADCRHRQRDEINRMAKYPLQRRSQRL
jgi:hypothetical protein